MNFPSSKNWKTTTLNKVVDLIGGGTPKTTIKKYWNGDIPWLSVVDFNNDARKVYKTEKTITQEGLKNSSTKLLNKGDIIISARGTVGALAQLAKPMAFNQSCYGIRAQNGYDQNFIYYLLKSAVPQLTKNVHGAVFDTLTRDSFASVSVSIPESPVEQKQLADLLGSFDNKIELLQKQNQTLESMAQALFKEWFVDFNFPGTTGKMVESELGMVPEGWRVGKLGDICDVSIGRTPPRNEEEWFSYYNKSNIKWISIKDLGNCGVYIFSTSEYLTNKAVKKFNIPLIPKNTVILSFKLTLGRVSITSEDMLSNEAIAHLKSPQGSTPEFLYLTMNHFDFDSLGSTSSIARAVNSQSIKRIEILIPKPDIMRLFDHLIKPSFDKIRNNSLEIQTLSKMRDELLNKIFAYDN